MLGPPPEPGMPRTPASGPCYPLGAWDRLHKPSGDGCIPRWGVGSLLGAHGAAWGTPKALPSSWHRGPSPPPAASQGLGVSLPVARLGLHQPRPWYGSQFWLRGAAGVSQGCTGTASALASIPLIIEKNLHFSKDLTHAAAPFSRCRAPEQFILPTTPRSDETNRSLFFFFFLLSSN